MVKAKVYIYANAFDGFPKAGDLEIVEEELKPIKDGEFLAEAEFLSVDPYMRGYAPAFKIGTPIIGGQIALYPYVHYKSNAKRIVEFKKAKTQTFQWGNISLGNLDGVHIQYPMGFLIQKTPCLSMSYQILKVFLHHWDLAFLECLEICHPKQGETVVISGAAGAVGSHVGQIAKLKGCKVIGIAGSDDKGKMLIDDLKFDGFVNYKDKDFRKVLRQTTPNGIDCYFDNVGGEISSTVISQMNLFGRISVCGAISAYNEKNPKASVIQGPLTMKQLKMEGFIVTRWYDRWMEGINQNLDWVKEGKIKYRETVTVGFENMFQAFTDMLKGVNYGKAIVRVKSIVK
ncbi:hypothetical protein HUJ04_004715 [Dendroctonus ponderosae]|nr:hypothetical protein HUJ04_004715 [Dendroctonus ponderosae]